MSDDAQFEAFLKGEDELSRRLQALPQPSPSAELDAAIMQRVKFAVAQQGRPAANDPGQDSGTPMLAPGLGRRWRIPAGIAASVLVGVFAHQAFDASNSQMALPQEETPAMIIMDKPSEPPSAAMALPPAEVVVAPAPKVAAPAPAVVAQTPVAPPPPPAPVQESIVEVKGERLRAPQDVESASPVTVLAPEPLPVPAPQNAERMSAAPMAKPAMADQASGAAGDKVSITGSRIRLAAPEELLGRIEAMLKAEQNSEALVAWDKFRAAYPDYPVPDGLEAKIKAAALAKTR